MNNEQDKPHHTTLLERVEAGLAAESTLTESEAIPSATATATPTLAKHSSRSSDHTVHGDEELKSHKSINEGTTPGINASTDLEKYDQKDKEGRDVNKNGLTQQEVDAGILTGLKLALVFTSMMLAVFMFALDQSIVATAIPVIVSDFQAFDAIAWVITAYFLTQCGLILLSGQLLTALKAKWVLLGAIFFFELGSLLCAVAKNMPLLIFGRAIQGIGASGMFVSILAVIAVVTKVRDRAAFMASFGFVFVISSVVGPLLGGVFTEKVSWTLCFWINLPFGAVAAAAVLFLLPARDPPARYEEDGTKVPTGWKAVKKMDFIGAGLILALITCLLLALQWGGTEYPWGNWRIILLFVIGGALIPVFGYWQFRQDKNALIPLSLLKNRTLICCAIFMFFFMGAMLGGTYQLPLYYQAGRQHSPQQSGIDIIPYMLSACVAIFVAGGLTTKFGRYYPVFVVGPPIATVGFGLLYTLKESTPNAQIIGFQILAGFGIGLAFQNGLIAVQAEFNHLPHLIPQASGVVSFFQLTGAAIGVGILNTVQSVFLSTEIPRLAPDVDYNLVRQSVSAILLLPAEQQPAVREAYIIAITSSFIPLIVFSGVAWIAALFIRNHNMKGMNMVPAAG